MRGIVLVHEVSTVHVRQNSISAPFVPDPAHGANTDAEGPGDLDHALAGREFESDGVPSGLANRRASQPLAVCLRAIEIQPPPAGKIVAFPEVGALHHRYERRAA
jgi:hypothetical protein